MTAKREWVVGFLLDETAERVVLIRTVRHWQRYACLTWEEGVVHFYRTSVPDRLFDACHTVTDEAVEVHRVHELLAPGPLRDGVTPNLLWLVPLAAHRHDTYDVIDVIETGTTMRKPGRLDVIA